MAERFVKTPIGPFRLEAKAECLTALEPVDRYPNTATGCEGTSSTPISNPDEKFLTGVAEHLLRYLKGEVQTFPFEYGRSGSPFVRSVLQALRDIPYGQTRTYVDIARVIGHDGAARAVGTVCANNRLLFVVPCHRVTASGSIGRYRLGSDIKRLLLRMEAGDATSLFPKTIFRTCEASRIHLSHIDARWARLVEEAGVLERKLVPDLFEGLLRSFVSQQISLKAAATIHTRLQANVSPLTPQHLLTVEPMLLRAQGLSEKKVSWILEAARRFSEGEFDRGLLMRLEDEAVVEKLMTLSGVGRWTAEMISLFTLGRENILSLGDLGIRRGLMNLYGQELSKEALTRIKRRVSPYGSAASLYLWYRAAGGITTNA